MSEPTPQPDFASIARGLGPEVLGKAQAVMDAYERVTDAKTGDPMLQVVFDAGQRLLDSRRGAAGPDDVATEEILMAGLDLIGRPGVEGALARCFNGVGRRPRIARRTAWHLLHSLNAGSIFPVND